MARRDIIVPPFYAPSGESLCTVEIQFVLVDADRRPSAAILFNDNEGIVCQHLIVTSDVDQVVSLTPQEELYSDCAWRVRIALRSGESLSLRSTQYSEYFVSLPTDDGSSMPFSEFLSLTYYPAIGGEERKVAVSDTDTTPDYLLSKLFSDDASVSFTRVGAGGEETIAVRSTGAGGGEANQGENVGLGAEVYAGMNGVNLELRTVADSSTITWVQGATELTAAVPAGTYDPFGRGDTVQGNLDAHAVSGDHDGRYLQAEVDPVFTASPAAAVKDDGVATEYLDGTGAYSVPPAAGGGESNTGENAGAGAQVYVGMNGTALQLRSLADTASLEWTQGATELTAAVPAGTYDPFGRGDTVQANLDAHKTSGDHDGRYLQAEVDPVFVASPAAAVKDDGAATEYLNGAGAYSIPPDGGESNTGENAGAGAQVYVGMNGTALQLRSLADTASLEWTQGATELTAVVPAGVFDPAGRGDTVQANLDAHKTSADHDARYHTKAVQDATDGAQDTAIAASTTHRAGAGDGVSAHVSGSDRTTWNSRVQSVTGSAVDNTDPLNPTVALPAGGTDELVAISATDTTPSFLQPKLTSSDASITITRINSGANEQLDLQSTGAGGGETNTGENIGAGAQVYSGKNGVALQMRSLVDTASIEWTQGATELTAVVPAGTYDPFGRGDTVQGNLDAHKTSGDHDARYLQAEADPVFTASPAASVKDDGVATEYLNGTGAYSIPPDGGESNTGENAGAGAQVYSGKNGVALQMRSLVDTASIEWTQGATELTAVVPAGTYDPAGSAATVQGNLDAHKTSGDHDGRYLQAEVDPVFVASPAAAVKDDGAATEYLNGAGAYSVPPGGDGEANTGENAGAGAQVYVGMNGTALQMRSLVDTATIEWTQGATELTAVVPANTYDPFGRGDTVQGNLDAHKTSGDHDTHNDGRYAPIVHSTGAGDGADAHVTALLKTNWNEAHGWGDHGAAGYIKDVVDDTAPVLGGDLTAGGASSFNIVFTDATDTLVGSIGYSPIYSGVGFGYTPTGDFVETDGGILLTAGQVDIYGSAASFKTLEHSDAKGYMDVRVNTQGTIYTSPSAAPSWQQTDTGTDVVDVPAGVPGAWAEITGLGITLAQDVAVDDVLDVTANITVTEIGGRAGTLSFGVGVDGSAPSVGTNPYAISSDFDGVVPVALKATGHGGLTTGQTLTIWVRMETRDHSQFDPIADGSTNPHDLIVGVASASGGAPSVNLGTTYAANSVTVTNSAGTNAVIAAATQSDAGVLAASDKTAYDGKWGPGSKVDWWTTHLGRGGAGTYNVSGGVTLRITNTSSGNVDFVTPAISSTDHIAFKIIFVAVAGDVPIWRVNGTSMNFGALPAWVDGDVYLLDVTITSSESTIASSPGLTPIVTPAP